MGDVPVIYGQGRHPADNGKNHMTIFMSTAEAEVMAAVSAAKESIHLKLLLGELGVKHDKILIKEDNTACIAQAKGGLRFIRKAKHYDIALRFIQKLAVDGEVDFEYTE